MPHLCCCDDTKKCFRGRRNAVCVCVCGVSIVGVVISWEHHRSKSLACVPPGLGLAQQSTSYGPTSFIRTAAAALVFIVVASRD